MGRTVQTITAKHRQIAYLRSQGFSYQKIAEKVGLSRGHVIAVLRNPKIKELVQSESVWDSTVNENAPVEEIIKRASPHAIQLLEQIVKDSETLGDQAPTIKQRIDAAIEILKMAGYAGNVKVDHTHRHLLQREDLSEIVSRARQQQVIDVEATPCEVTATGSD